MYGTHCKHCSLIPPLVCNNNLALLRCGYMCAGMLVHISRHLSRTSTNNNKRCQLIIGCMLCRVCFHRVLHWIFCLWTLLYYNCLHPALSLVFYFTTLISYLIIPCAFPTWYHLLSIYLFLYACAHDTIFNACLWFRFIDTRALIHARHLAFTTPLVRELWLPWILVSRSRRLELVDSPGCWSE